MQQSDGPWSPDPIRGSSEPGRFWTVTNVAEVTPDLLSPLCWSVWEEPMELGFRRTMADFGVLSRREAVFPADRNERSSSCFYGRQAVNVDLTRQILGRLPGVTGDDFERDILGSVRPDAPPDTSAPLRVPLITVSFLKVALTANGRLRRIHDDNRGWWTREVLGRHRLGPSDHSVCAADGADAAFERLVEGRARFGRAMHIHLTIRFLCQAAQSALIGAAEKAGDPALGAAVFAGFGDVAETEVADDVWRLAHAEITLDDFLGRHGYHGPNEGNLFTRSWRDEPARVLGLAQAYARRGEMDRPRLREERARRQREDAEARLLAGSPAASRPLVRFLFRRAANLVRNLELGKAAYLMGVDGARAAARQLGSALVMAGRLVEVDDVFFLTVPELDELRRRDVPAAAGLIEARKAQRAEYLTYTLPVCFTGMPVPTVEVERTRVTEVTGIGASAGRAEGRARVVLDPNDDVELDEGDILVCRITDPSWAPVFGLAEALVIDIGGTASHGAVVAREMGIPCVIGTGNGTAAIPDGAHIVVDGSTGTVQITGADPAVEYAATSTQE